ncbi:MAG: DUF6491 family protein [Dokdonella sp.]|uniref:DUF6491 family protein n=1 Tax=Dokdonella sp. TaxID=2291710 RepID=UPI0025BEC30B|nr:DUF6491 family protein [Dokdonella sp.]MBZ0223655.1 DUF6491 family protein [Dokdonella sp.]
MKIVRIGCVLLLATMACAAQADTREVAQKHLEEYTPYLEAPVDQFHYWSFDQWQPLGPTHVAVWTELNKAYLLTVENGCPNLEWANNIGVTSQSTNVVSKKFDYVTFDHQRCHITQIQPIDLARMKADSKAK